MVFPIILHGKAASDFPSLLLLLNNSPPLNENQVILTPKKTLLSDFNFIKNIGCNFANFSMIFIFFIFVTYCNIIS
jgi:hypothetical protein